MEREQLPPLEFERQFLENIRAQYEERGFKFTIAPTSDILPRFLGAYRPDAIAQKPGENIAIEVKRRQSSSMAASLREISNLFASEPEWSLKIVYAGSSPGDTLRIERVSKEELITHLERVEALSKFGEHRAALVMAWSLLEAALRVVDFEPPTRPRTPGTVLQTLVMEGYLDEEIEPRIRALINIRNRIVHGDVATEVSENDVRIIVNAVREVLESVNSITK